MSSPFGPLSLAPPTPRPGRNLLAALLLSVALGCTVVTTSPGPADAPAQTPTTHDAEAPPTVEPASAPTDGPDPACAVIHEGECHPSREAACEAAGCPLERCGLAKSLPAKIVCIDR